MKNILVLALLVCSNFTLATFFTEKIEEKFYDLDYAALEEASVNYSVGVIFPSRCPGTLVNGKFVLVAAHCIAEGERWTETNSLSFYFSNKETGLKEYRVTNRFGVTEKPHLNWGQYFTSHNDDIAILEIDTVLDGSAELVVFESDELLEANLRSIGFPVFTKDGAMIQKVMIDEDCEIKANFHDSVYLHNCGAYYGVSGGPILYKDGEGKNYVVGIQLGVRTGNTNEVRVEYNDNIGNYALLFDENMQHLSKIFSLVGKDI